MSLSRIYQGRVSKVEIENPDAATRQTEPWVQLPDWQNALWRHHVLFQDAVNYYIIAIASLGSSPESPLTILRGRLADVWFTADKKGQSREGLGVSLKRAFQFQAVPTLDEVVERFRKPLIDNGVSAMEMEHAGELLVSKLGGSGSIRNMSKEFWPLFCSTETKANPKDDPAMLRRAEHQILFPQVIHDPCTKWESSELSQFDVHSIASPDNKKPIVKGSDAREKLRNALDEVKSAKPEFTTEINRLAGVLAAFTDDKLEIPGFVGSSAKGSIALFLRAFLVFRYVEKSDATFQLLKSFTPRPKSAAKAKSKTSMTQTSEGSIRKARGNHGYIVRAFTSLPPWNNKGDFQSSWEGFERAAFEKTLEVINQFNQNIVKRKEKFDGFALKLLVMDGENAIAGYDGQTEVDNEIRARLQFLWDESKGRPKLPKQEHGEDDEPVSFTNDPRIERLRQIRNADLAAEYRLTDGRPTPYGLRRRTMKGWEIVKREWRNIVKVDTPFSEEKKQELQEKLNELRGGDKREQIGSHKLFSELIADNVAWAIWREPSGEFQDQINQKGWAPDPLEAFREYCETREALEEVSKRPLQFTPADARFSRRLFMFTDTCSFGNDRGEYKHDLSNLAVIVPAALADDGGHVSQTTVRISYSAPRLLRDRIRAEDGSFEQDWSQPMMRVLFGESEGKIAPQQLKDAAVALMPDFDARGNLRFLLNFPLSLDEKKLKEKVGKSESWAGQFMFWKKRVQFPYLLWPSDVADAKMEMKYWWDNRSLDSFRVLAADLGTRHTASVALLEVTTASDTFARTIGEAGGKKWFARYRTGKVLHLPGEDAQVARLPSKPEIEAGECGKAFREELYGSRGRSATGEELAETHRMLHDLGQETMADGLDGLSFPELNDKLLVAIRRTQNWTANCVSWLWKLENPEAEGQRTAAMQQLVEQDREPGWSARAKAGDADGLKMILRIEIAKQRDRVQRNLLTLTGRVLPLRGRQWEWIEHPETKYANCHLLSQTQEGTASYKVWLAGQRGLSIARIEQLSELRRRWQSLNQALRVIPGNRPPTAAEMRAESIPDPCPDILGRLENIREQRVNQTAHLILAEALGLKLRIPMQDAALRRVTDTHGEYAVVRPPVDFIVLEDLTRYLSDQGRAKSENSRLMKWCHRQIASKLKMLTEPFGISVLQTQAAYTSRFCSLTGTAGFRAVEVGLNDRETFRWRSLLALGVDKSADAWRSLSVDRREEVGRAEALFRQLETLEKAGQKNPTLLASQPGGPIFVAAVPVTGRSGKESVPMQADINAAVNIGLRAIAAPDCADIHHRVRTERKKDVIHTDKKETRRFGKTPSAVVLASGSDMPREKHTNLFYDASGVAQWGHARLATDEKHDVFPYATGSALWKTVNDRAFQWRRVDEINRARLARWDGKAISDEMPF